MMQFVVVLETVPLSMALYRRRPTAIQRTAVLMNYESIYANKVFCTQDNYQAPVHGDQCGTRSAGQQKQVQKQKLRPKSTHYERARSSLLHENYKTLTIICFSFGAFSKIVEYSYTKLSGFVQRGNAEIRCSFQTNPSRGS